jgi:hypothetical protein
VTFFRQMGGTLGTAVFLSVLFSALPTKITSAFQAAQGTPAFQQAAAAHPDQVAQLQNASGSLGDTSFVQTIDQALAAPFKTGFSDTLDLVFLIAAAVVALGFFVLIFLPQLPLRTQSGIQAAQAGASGGESGTGTDSPALAAEHAAGAAAPTSTAPPVDDVDRTAETDVTAGADQPHDRGRHQAGAHQATGLDSVPVEHLPEGVRARD